MSSQAVKDEAERDQLINEAAHEFPEYSELDELQADIYKEAEREGPRSSYPEYEGPGYTEPPVNWEGWHRDHTEEERDHYWDGEEHSADEPLPDASVFTGPEYGGREYHEDNSGDYDGYEGRPGVPESPESDAEGFARYYGEPPTPAAEREAGE